MICALAFLSMTALPPSVRVVFTGDVDPCDLATAVPAALERVLPGVPIRRGARDPKEGEVEVRIVSLDSVLVVEIGEPGKLGDRREIAQPAVACDATADGIALIVECRLRDLGYEAPMLELPARAGEAREEVPADEEREVTTSTTGRWTLALDLAAGVSVAANCSRCSNAHRIARSPSAPST